MANSAAFPEAIALAKANPKLAVGCHVMLVDGVPLLPPTQVSSLLAASGTGFRNSAADFARAAVRKQIRPEHVSAEAAAQIERLRSAGLTVSHIDTHKHTHIFPVVLRPLLQAAKSMGVNAVRNPFGLLDVAGHSALLHAPKLWLRRFQMKLLNRYSRGFAAEVKAAGMRSTDGAFGVLATGSLDQKTFRAILDSIPDGTWEFVCHPGYNDSELSAVNTRLRASRSVEREILTMPQVRDEVRQRGIHLISFADI